MTQAGKSGLIIATRVGKHTDEFISQLVVNTEGKTDCHQWHTDSWGGYERVLESDVNHVIGKDQTQQLERTNGIVRQHKGLVRMSGRWRHEVSPLGHRRQNKFAKVWE
jgi:insertion element IS1 protein InsB